MSDIIERLRAVAAERLTKMDRASCYETEAADEIERLRETNRRLNRRCQLYAKGMEEKIEKGRAEYRNLGRIFANATASAYEHKLEIIKGLCPKDHPLGAEILHVIERPFSDDSEAA